MWKRESNEIGICIPIDEPANIQTSAIKPELQLKVTQVEQDMDTNAKNRDQER